ncbi:ABC-type Fe3+-hydroxamate transport system, periplasmic component [Archaeoglobus fulgidus DSM 8774]|uniref:ABC-type Fe3+-hydroxamate transport system, periplasmic component n=1 Tax=Archaeoglobus fulgidus DSM 8774 TaxID=1344584 RepID=A0A075WCY9_ARCFL|nr:ABC transporter substrate-binding protein [Archaeoglobus fulgidus]AIG98275.1 ABC-type Fe3+-hydroxamate transport system, periplasmic component [Archaeoglobus fulgidus DSM 8774]
MRKHTILLLLLIAAILPLCSSKPAEEHTSFNLTEILNATPVDDTGYTINEGNPQRIVSLAPSNTEILFAIGAGDRVVGVTDYCNYPPEVVEKKKKGELVSIGGYTTINIEKVVSLKPDLVVATYGNGIENIETLRRMGLTVIAFDPKSVEDVMKDIILIGVATGEKENATKLVQEMLERIEKVRESMKDKPKVRVAHILWYDPIWVSGKNTFIDEVIRLAGGENVFNFDGWRTVSVEDLIAANPDVIIVSSGSGMGGGKDVVYEWVVSDDRLSGIKAVKEGRVYVVDADIINRPSYRLAEAIEVVADLIHK